MEDDELKLRIELERQKLYQLKMDYGDLLHPHVIQQSMVLDDLINQYNQVKIKKPME
ncbi:Spo0E family sporulation regulatory protein-aspartic acid phosphatase [Paenibacillus sp. FSL K6-0108]|uniref:Spo0E family sporulation regulatory protein-aspartic acid phosphatase n=1 Tax=Paenibacillus sp. FSL K6-0108 TaxID=2921417 RepID=UPI0032496ECF